MLQQLSKKSFEYSSLQIYYFLLILIFYIILMFIHSFHAGSYCALCPLCVLTVACLPLCILES